MTVIIILYYYFSAVIFSRKIRGTASHYPAPNEKHFEIIHSTTKYIIQIDFNGIVLISSEIYFRLKKTLLFAVRKNRMCISTIRESFFLFEEVNIGVQGESPLR